jgi:hypothetical protein
MRRDMELIRIILKALEEKEDATTEWSWKEIPGYSKEDIYYHYEMLSKAGLIEAIQYKSGQDILWRGRCLTWEGHDFLDAAKNEKVWNKAKEIARKRGGMFSIEILKKILSKLVMDYIFPELADT